MSGRPSFLDLFQMMPQMNQVVFSKEAQADHLVGSNLARHSRRGVWCSANHVRQMTIVEKPEIDELRPRLALIVLRLHLGILLVIRKGEFSSALRSDESLMVVGCRVNQVTNDFLDRPYVWTGFRGRDCFMDRPEFDRGQIDHAGKFIG